jgi:hypothetical protein
LETRAAVLREHAHSMEVTTAGKHWALIDTGEGDRLELTKGVGQPPEPLLGVDRRRLVPKREIMQQEQICGDPAITAIYLPDRVPHG